MLLKVISLNNFDVLRNETRIHARDLHIDTAKQNAVQMSIKHEIRDRTKNISHKTPNLQSKSNDCIELQNQNEKDRSQRESV